MDLHPDRGLISVDHDQRCRDEPCALPGDTMTQMPGLVIERAQLGGGWVSIAVEGEVDLATVDELTKVIDEIFDSEKCHLVVDLNSSSFMDSTGLKSLVMAERRFDEAKRQFAIAVDGGPISRLIDLSGVDSSIRVVSSVDQVS